MLSFVVVGVVVGVAHSRSQRGRGRESEMTRGEKKAGRERVRNAPSARKRSEHKSRKNDVRGGRRKRTTVTSGRKKKKGDSR